MEIFWSDPILRTALLDLGGLLVILALLANLALRVLPAATRWDHRHDPQ